MPIKLFGVLCCISETAKIEKILIAICIPQNEMMLITYLTTELTGRRKAIPAGMIKIPSEASISDNLCTFSFFVRSPAAMLHNIVH